MRKYSYLNAGTCLATCPCSSFAGSSFRSRNRNLDEEVGLEAPLHEAYRKHFVADLGIQPPLPLPLPLPFRC